MVVITQPGSSIGFYAHNGRLYNILIIVDSEQGGFRLSVPRGRNSKNAEVRWEADAPLPKEIKTLLNREERKEVRKFIKYEADPLLKENIGRLVC